MKKQTEKKVFLVHGDCDYLIFKELQSLKSRLKEEKANVIELFGKKDLSFGEIANSLGASDLFLDSNTVLVRNLMDARSFFGFVEGITDYLQNNDSGENDLYLFHFGKIPKTSRIYKAVSKKGIITEVNTPKPVETIRMIKKSLFISDSAAELLLRYANNDLFLIKNEIAKLKEYLKATTKSEIQEKDIKEICIKSIDQNEIWSIGDKLLDFVITKENSVKSSLLQEIDSLLSNNIAPMQILYSFYNYVLNGIKLHIAVEEGKSFKDCLSIGYFFVKEFYPKKDKLNKEELLNINSQLLEYEYGVKSGRVEEIMGLKNLMLAI